MINPNYAERDQFDIDHPGLNTARDLPKIAFRPVPNLDSGNSYMASWTTEVEKSYEFAKVILGNKFHQNTFIDVGCGKGKVNIIWQKLLERDGITQRNMGLDYYQPLITIARNNWKMVFPETKSEFILGDAATHEFRRYGERLLIYMFNPFSVQVMIPFIRNLKHQPTTIIYNVPACEQILTTNKFKMIHSRSGMNQNQTTKIYQNF
jgi:SAM-dependent methyltransferase